MYVFDIEADNLLEGVSKVHCIVVYNTNNDELKVFDYNSVREGAEFLFNTQERIAGHNILGYDFPVLEKLYGLPFGQKPISTILDTLVCSRALYPDIATKDAENVAFPKDLVGHHSLKAWGYRLGNKKLDFGRKPSGDLDVETFSVYTEEMRDYCIQDVMVTVSIINHFFKNTSIPEWLELEHYVARVCHKQMQYGFYFDKDKAEELYRSILARKHELYNNLIKDQPPVITKKGKEAVPKISRKGYREGCPFQRIEIEEFDPNSRHHIRYILANRYKVQFKNFTEKGTPIIDDDFLSELDIPELKDLAEYYKIVKVLGYLGDGNEAWLKHFNTKTHRIHSQINWNGTPTARAKHYKPNLAQVPSVRAYLGKECRELFTCPDDKILVGVDMSGLELRCLSHYLARYDGGAYANEVVSGDIHTANQQSAGLPTRDLAKRFIYAFIYGASDGLIGSIVGGTAKEGREIKEKFYKKVPAMKKLKEAVESKAKTQGYIRGLDGRRIPIRSPHSALNFLLQSAGAILMKNAIRLYHEELYRLNIPFIQVGWVHDEVIVETYPEYAEKIKDVVIDAMRKSGDIYGFRCKLDGEGKIGRSWYDVH